MPRLTGGDPDHKMYSLLSFAGLSRDIADPWYTGNFEDTYSDLETGLQAFWKYLLQTEAELGKARRPADGSEKNERHKGSGRSKR